MDLNLFRVRDASCTDGATCLAIRFGVRQGNRVTPSDTVRVVMAEEQPHLTGLQATHGVSRFFRAGTRACVVSGLARRVRIDRISAIVDAHGHIGFQGAVAQPARAARQLGARTGSTG